MSKKYWIAIVLITLNHMSLACEVCEKQQPKITAGLTHGVGPESNWDWVSISIITVFTLLTLFLSFKYLLKPGERNKNHIKRSIINSEH